MNIHEDTNIHGLIIGKRSNGCFRRALAHSSGDHRVLNTEDNNPVLSTQYHRALNTEDNNPTYPVQLCFSVVRIRRNLFRAFFVKASIGDTAGWHFG